MDKVLNPKTKKWVLAKNAHKYGIEIERDDIGYDGLYEIYKACDHKTKLNILQLNKHINKNFPKPKEMYEEFQEYLEYNPIDYVWAIDKKTHDYVNRFKLNRLAYKIFRTTFPVQFLDHQIEKTPSGVNDEYKYNARLSVNNVDGLILLKPTSFYSTYDELINSVEYKTILKMTLIVLCFFRNKMKSVNCMNRLNPIQYIPPSFIKVSEKDIMEFKKFVGMQ